ncbi:MAG: pyridoxamine 5'-phosphate oxidase [Motiliproteus sp.]|nr:pyridoxamine 5'-phosphate oxidase [Motiliproteus sp.]
MSSGKDLTEIRREYAAEELHMSDLAADPVAQFAQWQQQMAKLDPEDSTSMVLATASSDGCPSARIVLLKHFDSDGFCWYTDYLSQKGEELDGNPQAELLFYWRMLERQVRIWGTVERLPRAEAERYFSQRPRGSQLSAAASVQSSVVSGRSELEQRYQALDQRYQQETIPCPENWGGYRLLPQRFEFWQGRPNRLHDRIVYSQQLEGWQRVRITP